MRVSFADIAEQIQTAQDPEALWGVLRDYLHSFGVTRMSYHHYSGLQGIDEPAVGIRAEGFPEPWVCQYIGEALHRIDPIPQLARLSTKPFRWSDVADLMTLSPEQQDYLERLSASGVGDGYALQLYGPAMRNGYVGLGFDTERANLSPHDLATLHAVAQLGHLRYCALTHPEEALGKTRLTKRERVVLEWAARGKSNANIAKILGVSPHTVDTQMRRIYAKLDVTDRTSACLRGLGAGLILPGR